MATLIGHFGNADGSKEYVVFLTNDDENLQDYCEEGFTLDNTVVSSQDFTSFPCNRALRKDWQ